MSQDPTQTPDPTANRLSSGFGDEFSDLSALEPTSAPTKPVNPPPAADIAPIVAVKADKPKAKAVKPKRKATKPGIRQKSDAVAKAHGFTSREPAQPVLLKKRRRVQHEEPVDQLSIRGPVRVLNGFIDYCEANQLSYWEAMEQLVEGAS